MAERIVVDLMPVAMQERTDEQQQGALWLMEIRNEHLHNLILITRRNDYLRAGM